MIVPMLVASLADGAKLLRITVLSSLRRANAADWQLKCLGHMAVRNERTSGFGRLGGLLGRRIYPLFFRRDLAVSEAGAPDGVVFKGAGMLRQQPKEFSASWNRSERVTWPTRTSFQLRTFSGFTSAPTPPSHAGPGKHVLVTVPEHRLSMENKAIELAWKGDITESQALHRAFDFLKANGRDILDESDETLAEHVWFSRWI